MEEMIHHPTDTPQQQLVRDYCSDAEAKIMTATSREEATTIKDAWCKRFRHECESRLIVHAASAYLDEIIIRMWKEKQT